MNAWLFALLSNVMIILLWKFLISPSKKKLIVNPSEYEYINKAYLYVDNKVYGDIKNREVIEESEIRKLLSQIPKDIQYDKELGVSNSYINSILVLQEWVRKYSVRADKDMIKQLDSCMEYCDYTHICIMLEVRAILCAQLNHK